MDIMKGYREIFVDKRDRRVDAYPLMASPLPTLLICLSYVVLVKKVGPWWMKSRPAFDLRKTLIVYNGGQVIFSAWLFLHMGSAGWFRGYSFTCQPIDYSEDPWALKMINACWWYYFSKYFEFLDTIFFILRKKDQHVTALHVIHHGCMPLSVWFGLRFTPGGHSTFFGFLNTLVHVIMYFYYMVAAMGPRFTKYLWWKKYLTKIQMLQFVIITIHAFQLLFRDCDYPRGFVWFIGGHGVMFLSLFVNFYRQEYYAKRKWITEQVKIQ